MEPPNKYVVSATITVAFAASDRIYHLLSIENNQLVDSSQGTISMLCWTAGTFRAQPLKEIDPVLTPPSDKNTFRELAY